MAEFEQRNSVNLGYPGQPDFENKTSKQKPKLIFAFVGMIGIVALFLGFLRLSQFIKSPFQPIVSFSPSTFLSEDQLTQINLLKNKDTDSDGLSDYDELYYHNTSPYLKDSDSDGFTDKEDIETNNDPNCPSGEDCVGLANTNTNSSLTNSGTNTNSLSGNTNTDLLSGSASAETLRETLKNAGVPQYILDSTDDATLLEVYNQTVTESKAINANTNTGLNTNISLNTNATVTEETPPEEFYDALKELTPEEIRLLLIESGVEESQLELMDDNTLQAIFLKALEEEQAK